MLSSVLFCIILIHKTPTILYHKEPYPNWQILKQKTKKNKEFKGKAKTSGWEKDRAFFYICLDLF